MTLIFLPEAQVELDVAEAYYKAKEMGLERRFVDEIAEVAPQSVIILGSGGNTPSDTAA